MRRRVIGTVTRDKMAKTRRVEVPRSYRHPKYGKTIRSRTVCYVHDEQDTTHNGDLVEIIETRPKSKLKRWDLVRVVKKFEAPVLQAAPVAATAAAEPAVATTAE
jgi:small subunit ribosomal protein S17